MKKIHFLSVILVAFSAILFFSCNKDDDGGSPDVQKNEIYGEWELVEQIAGNEVIKFDHPDCRQTYTFYRKGNLNIRLKDYANDLEQCMDGGILEATFSLNKNILSVTSSDDNKTVTFNVERLTHKQLEISGKMENKKVYQKFIKID